MNHEEQQLQKDEQYFAKQLSRFFSGKERSSKPIRVMESPLVIQLIGIKAMPISIAPSTLEHIQVKHKDMSEEILKKIPAAMAEPMMIFKSHTVSNRIVLALDLKDNQGVDIIVPLELEAVKGREKTHIITLIYGRGYGSGRTRSTDHVWYINNVMGGSTLYVNKRKAKNFYQSARLQLPMEGKRFFDLFDSSIKTEEDLVKFKLQKEEEEYKAAAAREAANEKDSSLQTQPADKSHLQLRGTASYEPMVTDSIKAVNKEEAKMTAGNQAGKEEAKTSGISPEIEERVDLRMAKAGMGAYTIRMTLERESPLHEDMKAGKAKGIAEAVEETHLLWLLQRRQFPSPHHIPAEQQSPPSSPIQNRINYFEKISP